ncbi:hypothetical protein P153DRAFT_93373 [Dothidotthia symphoricarpi CBS 119687]|uniref:Uncharacterized protein n=1 Tax=Dothidotthia symphoricarpi CBS 119687 TaxID=1392245 RepID=A0A6A6A596_9PLEO|nr:uncharacterized protein P153DRAFT_93373 [Dothidotthia symphoricarpi CBS 119687]KAF2125771.1 hypothetical protein P153DRAFT_93373 [Dothidotthia symphoricarpi CBS 119687]
MRSKGALTRSRLAYRLSTKNRRRDTYDHSDSCCVYRHRSFGATFTGRKESARIQLNLCHKCLVAHADFKWHAPVRAVAALDPMFEHTGETPKLSRRAKSCDENLARALSQFNFNFTRST